MRKYQTKDVVLGALLTALSLIITFSPFKLPVPAPFSVTLGSHVPTMIALFINPAVTLFTVIGSCIGFIMATPDPIIIPARAAMHIIFALVGRAIINHKVLKNDIANLIFVIVLTSVIHAGSEAIVVYILTPVFAPAKMNDTLVWFTFIGTVFHHYVDTLITVPVAIALQKSGFIHTGLGRAKARGTSFDA